MYVVVIVCSSESSQALAPSPISFSLSSTYAFLNGLVSVSCPLLSGVHFGSSCIYVSLLLHFFSFDLHTLNNLIALM
jgi:hypothetical protein